MEELAQKVDVTSVVWAHFGHIKHDTEQNKAKCKYFWKIAAATNGSTALCHINCKTMSYNMKSVWP